MLHYASQASILGLKGSLVATLNNPRRNTLNRTLDSASTRNITKRRREADKLFRLARQQERDLAKAKREARQKAKRQAKAAKLFRRANNAS